MWRIKGHLGMTTAEQKICRTFLSCALKTLQYYFHWSIHWSIHRLQHVQTKGVKRDCKAHTQTLERIGYMQHYVNMLRQQQRGRNDNNLCDCEDNMIGLTICNIIYWIFCYCKYFPDMLAGGSTTAGQLHRLRAFKRKRETKMYIRILSYPRRETHGQLKRAISASLERTKYRISAAGRNKIRT